MNRARALRRLVAVVHALQLLVLAACGGTDGGAPCDERSVPAADAPPGDWPHRRGPDRDGASRESSRWNGGSWPPGGIAWRRDVGLGASSPIAHRGRVYAAGWRDGADTVVCLDAATGDVLWSQSYPCPQYGRHATGDQYLYSGHTSTPELAADASLLFTLGADGDLNAWNSAARGERVWGLNLYAAFGAGRRPKATTRGAVRDYGYTTSPLALDGKLIVEVGADAGSLVAFDPRSGAQLWTSEHVEPAGHTGGPVPITVEGVPCVAVLTLRSLVVVRLDPGNEGRTLARVDWATNYANNVVTPAVLGDSVLVTAGYNHNSIARYRFTLAGAEKVWEQEHFSKVCTPVIHRGRIYWAWHALYCLDFATGARLWQGGKLGDAASLIATADDRLVIWGDRGTLALADTEPCARGSYRDLARREILSETEAWPHAALHAGRLFLKDRGGALVCWDLEAASR